MIIILWGVKSSMGDDYIYVTDKCRHCGAENSITVLPYYKYFHLFGLPVFPLGKDYEIKCLCCDHIFNEYQVNIDDIKKSVRIPLWTFSGLAIIVVFASYFFIKGIVDSSSEKAALKAAIENPEGGQIIEVKNGEEYSFMRVSDFSDDSIYMQTYSLSTNNRDQLKFLWLHKGAFSEKAKGLSKKETLELADNGVLLKIYPD